MAYPARRGDGPLWMTALGLSLLVNSTLLAAFGFAALQTELLRRKTSPEIPPPSQTVATIFPEMIKRDVPSATASITPAPISPPPSMERDFARTSDDQTSARPENPTFIGERNTTATSDRAPVQDAPALPSQSGIDPRHSADFETTTSRYQDGSLAGSASPTPVEPTPPAPDVPAPLEPTSAERTAPENLVRNHGEDDARSLPPAREKLLEGPNPVDVQVPRETSNDTSIKPAPEKRPRPVESTTPPETTTAPKPADLPKPKPVTDPAFKGNQHKTAIVGSISRTGRSALDVEDTPLGRYQAVISRAVELEWQRNCVRHRDFITPGFLTVRFFVETKGKVRSVQFVGDMETGEVQKGFTLNSIRDAEIPAMPPALRKDYEKDPLELIFRFYF